MAEKTMSTTDHTANNGALLTDLYQLTMLQAYFDRKMNEDAVFEFFVRRLPVQRNFLVAAGLEQALEYLQALRFTNDDIEALRQTDIFHEAFLGYLRELRFSGHVDAMREGTLFFANEPIVRVTAPLPEAQVVESRLVNILHFQTLIASKAARCVLAADLPPVVVPSPMLARRPPEPLGFPGPPRGLVSGGFRT